ncbi:MAG: hypothetical protein JJT89_12720 [Nitriliruptoraceae bacterium]|nr:hypothetical protein [Nitriliruptoraceae bacterium]
MSDREVGVVPGRHGRLALPLGVVVLVLGGCSSVEVQRAEWVLNEPAEGTTLNLAVFAGHSSCIDFDRVDVLREGSSHVELHAFVAYNGDASCTDDWGIQTVSVELAEPLGDRQLVGCAGDGIDWHGWRLDRDADCAQVRDEHL